MTICWSAASLRSWRRRWTATLMAISQRMAGGRLIARSLVPRSGPGRLTSSNGIGNSAQAATLSVFLRRALAHRTQPQSQRVQLDETLGIPLIIGALVVLEGDRLHGIERPRRLAANDA